MNSATRPILVFGIVALVAVLVFSISVLDALALGWYHVLMRIGPRIEINGAAIASGLVCVAATVVLTHSLGCWIYCEVRPKQDCADWPTAWRWKWTLCLTLAVGLMFTAGVVGVGLFRTWSWFLETPEIFRKTTIFDEIAEPERQRREFPANVGLPFAGAQARDAAQCEPA